MSRTFLILHGFNGSGLDHWQTLLAQRLGQRGETVFYPDLSGKEEPDRRIWLNELREKLASIPNSEGLTVVCHSLSCILWMHNAKDRTHPPVERLILVAPPGPRFVREFRPTFFPIPMDAESLHASARLTLLICTNGDPRCSEKAVICYGRNLAIDTVVLPDEAAHINTASGFREWPGITALCLASGLPADLVQPAAVVKAGRARGRPPISVIHNDMGNLP